jgi:hypothetical protein
MIPLIRKLLGLITTNACAYCKHDITQDGAICCCCVYYTHYMDKGIGWCKKYRRTITKCMRMTGCCDFECIIKQHCKRAG